MNRGPPYNIDRFRGNSRLFGSQLCMVFKGRKPRFFPMKVSLMVMSHADLLKGSSQVTAPHWGGLRDTEIEAIFKGDVTRDDS